MWVRSPPPSSTTIIASPLSVDTVANPPLSVDVIPNTSNSQESKTGDDVVCYLTTSELWTCQTD